MMDEERSRMLAAVAAALLLSVTVAVGSGASPPIVDVSQALSMESGSRISVVGILVDLWARESGAVNIILADLNSGLTIRVCSMPDRALPPGSYVSIGDELIATGELSTDGTTPTVYCGHGDIRLIAKASIVLTLGLLCRSYELFLGDIVEVRGSIFLDDEGQAWLTDGVSQSIRLRIGSAAVIIDESGDATVRAELLLDASSMTFYLSVLSVYGTR